MASAISRSHTSPHRSVVRVSGELDLVSAPVLRAVLTSADADTRHEFVVEFSGVTFMDCSGLAPLLEAHARLGGRLHLCDLPRAVSWLLHLAGLDATFAIDSATRSSAPGGGAGPLLQDVARDDPRLPWATSVDEDALVRAEGEETRLDAREAQPAAPGGAIGRRITIEQATGLLMASLGCDARQASRALLQMSWEQDTSVHDVADALVAATRTSPSLANTTEFTVSGTRRAAHDGSTGGRTTRS
jgi:anti-anti-sigma factor